MQRTTTTGHTQAQNTPGKKHGDVKFKQQKIIWKRRRRGRKGQKMRDRSANVSVLKLNLSIFSWFSSRRGCFYCLKVSVRVQEVPIQEGRPAWSCSRITPDQSAAGQLHKKMTKPLPWRLVMPSDLNPRLLEAPAQWGGGSLHTLYTLASTCLCKTSAGLCRAADVHVDMYSKTLK